MSAKCAVRKPGDVAAIDCDGAGCEVSEPNQAPTEGGLAAARFAYETKGFPGADL